MPASVTTTIHIEGDIPEGISPQDVMDAVRVRLGGVSVDIGGEEHDVTSVEMLHAWVGNDL